MITFELIVCEVKQYGLGEYYQHMRWRFYNTKTKHEVINDFDVYEEDWMGDWDWMRCNSFGLCYDELG